MNPSNPNIDTILAQAVEIAAPEDRQVFVEQACGGDHALKLRVEQLIANHFQAGSFLERPAAAAMDPDRTAGWEAAGSAEGPGTVIGPYRLLEQIGEGGMGLVYVAEQREPIRRRVALKIIKPGMDSRQVVARFEAERQALALMDHPHIAKVHDAGTTPPSPPYQGGAVGRPFFVMELVKGTSITDYCDKHRLTTRQRLGLFLDVCHAVQHAHQKGIIHRDLKPSNVMVSVHDVTPVVKVIDFGIAKAIGGRLTDKTVYTTFAQMVGTPLYMSPEQAGLSDLDIDTRSDVYSLGVLLYELLTGTTPFDAETLKEAGYDEMRRIIREDEPPQPSTRLSGLEKAKLSTISEHRGTEPRKLNREVRGELDWIAMKCLEKDRTRRYESASALAADVQRFLSDEPVQACPPSAGYRLRKFARRHKARLGAAAGLLLMLSVGAGALWRELGQRAAVGASVESALERADILRQQERWQEASAVLAVARGQLEGRGLAALRKRVEQSQRDVEMLMSLEEARLQESVVGQAAPWDYGGADRLYTKAFQRYGVDAAALAPEESARRIRSSAIRNYLTDALDDWAVCCDSHSVPERARALRAAARLADDDPWRQRLRDLEGRADRAALAALAQQAESMGKSPASLRRLGKSLKNVGSVALEEQLLRQAQTTHPADFWLNFTLAHSLDQSKKLEGAIRFYQAALALRPQSASVLAHLGGCLAAQGNAEEAEACYREAIALEPDPAKAHVNLGIVFASHGKLAEAEAAFRKAVALEPSSAEAHGDLGVVLHRERKLTEAEAAFRKAIALAPKYALAHCNLGLVLRHQGKRAEAEAACRKAIALEPDLAEAHASLGAVLSAAPRDPGRLNAAIAEYREAIRLDPQLAEPHISLGAILCDEKHEYDAAVTEFREAIRLDPENDDVHYNLGVALKHQSKLDEAIAEYREAVRLNPDNADNHHGLGVVFNETGQLDEAIAEFRAMVRINRDLPDAHYSLGRALGDKGRLDEAIAEYRAAVKLKEDYPEAHTNLGSAYLDKGRLDDAIAEFRQALRTKKDFPDAYVAHTNLGRAFGGKGRPNEAIAEYQQALRLKPDHAEAHNKLAETLHGAGRLDEAIAEYQKVIRLQKTDPWAHYNLGRALLQQGKLDWAIAEYREAIRLKGDFAEPHCNLGIALVDQGQFAQALIYLRRGHQLGSKRPNWRYPSDEWVHDCERLVELDARLPAVVSGQKQPADNAERIALAQLCQMPCKQQFAVAARLYAEAFAADVKLAENLRAARRYDAACAAALAGCGQGKDAAGLGEKERGGLRRQALDWLKADLQAWRRLVDEEPNQASRQAGKKLRHWLQDPDLGGVRGADALARLPEAERQAWQLLWADVAEALKRGQGERAPKVTPNSRQGSPLQSLPELLDRPIRDPANATLTRA